MTLPKRGDIVRLVWPDGLTREERIPRIDGADKSTTAFLEDHEGELAVVWHVRGDLSPLPCGESPSDPGFIVKTFRDGVLDLLWQEEMVVITTWEERKHHVHA